jgi:hypothetical protein
LQLNSKTNKMKKILLSVAIIAASFISNAQLIVNGDFEAAATPLIPGVATQTLGWGQGLYTMETTGAFAGTQSCKLTTIVNAAVAGQIGSPSDTIPGFAVQVKNGAISNPENLSISFAYKFTSVASDTGVVIVNLYDTLLAGDADDVVLFQGFAEFTATTSAWGTMTIPVAAISGATGTVNQFYFVAVSSNNALPSPGTTLWLDNITTGFVGIDENELISASVYPNPATEVLNIKMNEEVTSVVITALDGKTVATTTSASINISALNSGIYLYTITSVSGKVAKGNFVKN